MGLIMQNILLRQNEGEGEVILKIYTYLYVHTTQVENIRKW